MIRFLSRQQWRARDLPRRGIVVPPSTWTEVFVHHTALPRNGTSPNEWSDLDEIRAMMVTLQTARPELGLDVPYSFVAFCRDNGDVVLCEGRGLDRTGAHTAGHNDTALAIAFAGNFERLPIPQFFENQLHDVGAWLWRVKRDLGGSNIGIVRPFDRDVWGHRDVRNTLCPGEHLYDRLGLIRYFEEDDGMDQVTWQVVQAGLQALDPPLYAGRPIDGLPGANTHIAVQGFETRLGLNPRGVVGTLNDPTAGMWPATRELLFAGVYSPWTPEHEHEVDVTTSPITPVIDVRVGRVKT